MDEEKWSEVLKLAHGEKKSRRAIAKELGMSRNTVRRLLSGRGIAVARGASTSMLSPHEAQLCELLRQSPGIRAPAVLERLRADGYAGGVTIIRQWLRRARPHQRRREAFLTLEFGPGEAAQVDWADFGYALAGCARRVSCFVMVQCYSRQMYLEFTLSQRLPSLLRCMEHAHAFFGGTTSTDIFDNMKTVVRSLAAGRAQFNPQFMAYATSRGFSVTACNPRRGNEKGRVERPIGFIRERFWPGRKFQSLLDLNTQAFKWRDEFANRRVHEVTGKVPELVWRNEEASKLKPLPDTPYDVDDLLTTTVTKMFRVRFDSNDYSVPHHLVGQQVLVRANMQAVKVFLGPKLVAEHRRSWDVGEPVTLPAHQEGLLQLKPRALAGLLPAGLRELGDVGENYLKLMRASTRSMHAELRRLIWLCEMFGASATATAMQEVMHSGHVGVEYVEHVLRHRQGLKPQAAPLKLGDPNLDDISLPQPDLAPYDELSTHKTLDPHDDDDLG